MDVSVLSDRNTSTKVIVKSRHTKPLLSVSGIEHSLKNLLVSFFRNFSKKMNHKKICETLANMANYNSFHFSYCITACLKMYPEIKLMWFFYLESPTILSLLSWVFIKGLHNKNFESGIRRLKLFYLFQAFSLWGSSKRCEQKKKDGVAPYFFLALCLLAAVHYPNAWKKLETISWRVSLSDFGMVSWFYFVERLR